MGHLVTTVSPIGFGAFKIGRNVGTKYARSYDLPDQRMVDALLGALLDMGINYIDTAPAYGVSEERIGAALGARRDRFVISTKVGETSCDGVSTYDFSATAVRASVERSLCRLRTDALDLVFVHAPRDDMAVLNGSDVVATLHELRDEGLVGAIGFSGYTAEAFRSALGWADAIMIEYHPDARALEPVVGEAAEAGVQVMVKKGLASGRLSAAEAVRFVLSNPGVTSMVIGSLSADHMRENMRIAREVRGAALESS